MCLENVLFIQDIDIESTGMPCIHPDNRQRTAQIVLSVSHFMTTPHYISNFFLTATLYVFILNYSTWVFTLPKRLMTSNWEDFHMAVSSLCASWPMCMRLNHLISFAAQCLKSSYVCYFLAKVVNDAPDLFKCTITHLNLDVLSISGSPWTTKRSRTHFPRSS